MTDDMSDAELKGHLEDIEFELKRGEAEKIKRLENQRLQEKDLDEIIDREKSYQFKKKFTDKIPSPLKKFTKGVVSGSVNIVKAVGKGASKLTASQPSPRKRRYVERPVGNAFSYLNSFSGSMGMGSQRSNKPAKPHNPLSMTNDFGNMLMGKSTAPVVKRKARKKKQSRTQYIILR